MYSHFPGRVGTLLHIMILARFCQQHLLSFLHFVTSCVNITTRIHLTHFKTAQKKTTLRVNQVWHLLLWDFVRFFFMRFFFMSSGGSKSESSPEETRNTFINSWYQLKIYAYILRESYLWLFYLSCWTGDNTKTWCAYLVVSLPSRISHFHTHIQH